MVTPAIVPSWLASEYPFQPHAIRTPRRARMSYLDEGPRSDEAVLMLHGNPTWSFYYRRLVRELSPHLRCVAPDHVGMGLSDQPAYYDYTLATRIADLELLVEHLGLKRIHLVVHDWGGAIGFGFAARHPDKIGRLVVMNSAAFPSPRIPARIALCRAPIFGEILVRGFNGFAWPATWMAMHRRSLGLLEKRGYLLPYSSWASRIAVHAFVRDIPMTPQHRSWPALAEAEAGLAQFRDRPLLLAWGAQDFCFDETFLLRWRELFPNARCVRLADAGHYVLEDAAEDVIPLIREHLLAGRDEAR